MKTVRLRRVLDSDTLHLPELKPFIGKTVEITIRDEATPVVTPGTGDWSAWEEAADDLEGYDFDAVRAQREYDLRHAEEGRT
jgi:hypothetical protein